MATIDNSALRAIAQAKYRQNELLEGSRDELNDRQRRVAQARAALEQVEARHAEQSKYHAKLQAEMTDLNKAEAILEKYIKEEKGES